MNRRIRSERKGRRTIQYPVKLRLSKSYRGNRELIWFYIRMHQDHEQRTESCIASCIMHQIMCQITKNNIKIMICATRLPDLRRSPEARLARVANTVWCKYECIIRIQYYPPVITALSVT